MKSVYAVVLIALSGAGVRAQDRPANSVSSSIFTNPLLPSGPDPWVTFHDGYYYYMNTTRTNFTIWKTRDVTDLEHAAKKSSEPRRRAAPIRTISGLPNFTTSNTNGTSTSRRMPAESNPPHLRAREFFLGSSRWRMDHERPTEGRNR